ncbi:hypothetical protein HQ560_11370 [bacterium]|nr:hypothetical protein [bacterium]
MNRDPNEFESYPGDSFHSVNREDWDEDDWEQFLLRQDALNAKYQELYETLRCHPERDEIIAREMNWNLPPDIDDDDALFDDDLDDLTDEQGCDEESCSGCNSFMEEDAMYGLDDIPVYELAQEFAADLEGRVAPFALDDESREDEIMAVTQIAYDVPARIVNGHGIGYERDALCGNIACCKRALASLNECVDGLLCLLRDGVCQQADVEEFLRRSRTLGEAIAHRIDSLRSQVWWA